MTFQAPPPDAPRESGGGFDTYLTWHAQGSAAHGIPPATFSARATGPDQPKVPVPEMATGVVWDIENIETGWLLWPKGGEKDYRANPSVSQPLPFPGAGFTENIKIPMALNANRSACWDQASAGSWKGFCQIAAVIAQQAPQNPGLLPVIQFTGATLTSTGQNSTQVPNFTIVQWVQRPPCLSVQEQAPAAPANGGFQQQPAPQPQAAPAQPFEQQPAPAPQPQPQQPQPAAPAAPAAPAGAWN